MLAGISSHRQWWYKTGPILLKLMTSSNYSIEQQHQYLEFYASVSIPFLGSYPQVVRSSLTRSGLPMEFSANYQQHGKQPTDRDMAKEFLSTLSELEVKGFDSRLWDTVSQSIHLDATEKAILQEIKINDTFLRAQTLFGIDFVGDGAISVKAYVFPWLKCKISGQSSRELLANTVQGLQRQVDCSEVFSMVDCYLQETNSYNLYTFFSWDCIKPSDSRLKLYMCSASMMRAKLEDAWSLGSQLLGPPVMRSEDPSPLTKIYLPVHGENDLKIATGVAHFMEEIGMVNTGKTYLDTIQTYFPGYDLEQTDRLTSWISFVFTEITGLYLSIHYHSSTDNPWAAEEKQQPSLGEL
ncbi:tryptophan dimethylallyltransferase-domain-containing protein [Aspergillus sergii]|uniref:Tryptophan dimethylallyltransferase-domain-containing protein n=1 Tax=Aspergillus sergii TaxID=1034303 RepID=A0A5N6WUD9_9EURO|nr:tryptophan dimethylallyltransferase-domain-containing protein [Aspergillus sergii]